MRNDIAYERALTVQNLYLSELIKLALYSNLLTARQRARILNMEESV